jgi:hypothetical protein
VLALGMGKQEKDLGYFQTIMAINPKGHWMKKILDDLDYLYRI